MEDGAVRGVRQGVDVAGWVGVKVALGKLEEKGASLTAGEIFGKEEGAG